MGRCYSCKGEALTAATAELELAIAGRTFQTTVAAIRCTGCGEQTIPGLALGAFELDVAGELARHGEVSAEAFKFMRKAIGMRAVEFAGLLDVTHETVSRWEHGHLPVERRAAALLSAMVLDRLEGCTTTLDRLKALLKPDPLPPLVRLVPRAA
jgi:putative zinc finger/helix-turn-helix YgiT family protein